MGSGYTLDSEYKGYLQQAESLPREMSRRGVQVVIPHFRGADFRVYSDGTAEVPVKNQPLLSRMGLKQKETIKIGLRSVGELLYYLMPRYQEIPKNLNSISSTDLKDLSSALWVEEDACVRKSNAPVEGL